MFWREIVLILEGNLWIGFVVFEVVEVGVVVVFVVVVVVVDVVVVVVVRVRKAKRERPSRKARRCGSSLPCGGPKGFGRRRSRPCPAALKPAIQSSASGPDMIGALP